MEELRALRQGPQPCSSNDDCTVWHNGEYWDGCPVEVNVKNAARLDELRAMAEATGCEIQTGGNCPARIINGCGGGVCGHNAALVQSHNSLTPEQEKALTERIRKMAEQAGITLDASTAADAAGNAQ